MRKLIQWAFLVLVLMVGALLVYHLPPVEKARKIPASEIVTFEVDHSITKLHRNLKRAHTAEIRADRQRGSDGVSSLEEYELALEYFERARHYAGTTQSGYVEALIDRSVARIRTKIHRLR